LPDSSGAGAATVAVVVVAVVVTGSGLEKGAGVVAGLAVALGAVVCRVGLTATSPAFPLGWGDGALCVVLPTGAA
jgi:hypothetical protein